MSPLEKDALVGALLDPLIARLKPLQGWFSPGDMNAVIDALTKCREALLGEGWQDISTAPKYTPVRLYAQGGGFYDEDFNPSGSVEGHWSDDTHWCGAFWNPEQDCWDRRDGIVPTHWQPLPTPLAACAPGTTSVSPDAEPS